MLNLLSETGMLGSKPADNPVHSSVKLDAESFSLMLNYRRLAGKLIIFVYSRLDTVLIILSHAHMGL